MQRKIVVYALVIWVIAVKSGCDENGIDNDTPNVHALSLEEALNYPLDVASLTLRDIGDSLDPRIGELQNLTYLTVVDSELEYLPEEVGGLSKIGGVDLTNNHYNHIPTPLLHLENIRDLNMSRNSLAELPIKDGNWQ